MAETESQKRARAVLKSLLELRKEGTYEERRQLLQGLSGRNEVAGTSSRETDSLSPLLSKLQARQEKVLRVIQSVYGRARQLAGYRATATEIRDKVVEELNAMTLPSVEVNQERHRCNEMAWRLRDSPQAFIDWLLEEYEID